MVLYLINSNFSANRGKRINSQIDFEIILPSDSQPLSGLSFTAETSC